MLYYSIPGRMLKQLYGLQRLTSTRISKELGVDVRTVTSFFSSLRRAGVYLKPDIDISALGVCHQMVVLDGVVPTSLERLLVLKPSFIKSVLYIYPRTTILVFETKRCVGVPYEWYCIRTIIRSRPDPVLLFRAARGEYEKVLVMNFDGPAPTASTKRVRLDWVDLEILRAVSRSPEVKLRNLAVLLNLRVKTVATHVVHAENVVSGYRVSKIVRVDKDSGLVYIVVANTKNPVLTCRYLIRHPLVLGCGVAGSSQIVVQIILPPALSPKFISLLSSVPEITIEKIYVGPLVYRYVSTSGSRSTGEYSSKHGWLEPDIEETIRMLMEMDVLQRV